MLRRSVRTLNYWAQYSFAGPGPKVDGPPPKDAPQNFNSTKAETSLDPSEDNFPVSIRGRLMYPDVPLDQLTPMWYVCERTDWNSGELKSWVASAPPNAYRFRPFDEFDAVGRQFVEELKRYNSRAKDGQSFQFREASLTKMRSEPTPKMNLSTIMDRAVKTKLRYQPNVSPLSVQRDVGRKEIAPAVAGSIPVDATVFPFKWNTEDWYEYEISKSRNKRFRIENVDSLHGSEVTYKIVIESLWDVHALRMAEDVSDFVRDVGRQIIEERVITLRRHLESLRNGGPVDEEILAASPGLSEEEVRQHCESELTTLEEQCVSILSKTSGQAHERADANKSWPVIEYLDPWVRLAEYWAAMGDKHWSHMQMSTRKVEFRKFYRTVTVKMPFVSLELEKRIYDIRHWAHRMCTVEFQTIFKRNVVHDTSMFPVEHDYASPMSEENHRSFSFALDWEQTPARQATVETVRPGDTFASIASRLGTSVQALREVNMGVNLIPNSQITVPLGSTKALTSFGHGKAFLNLCENGKPVYTDWESIANALNCEVSELQEINQQCCDAGGKLLADVQKIVVPASCVESVAESEFATQEMVHAGDTWLSIAQRLGTSHDDLRSANPGRPQVEAGLFINIPETAKNRRRVADPLLSIDAADVATSRLRAEMQTSGLQDGLPRSPEDSNKFHFEFLDSSTRYPFVPQQTKGASDWLSYTTSYLDPGLAQAGEAQPLYTVNKLWPQLIVPGKEDQTPFEEDQTWMLHHIPMQRQEMIHTEGYLQDLHNVNHEVFPRSLEWQSP